MLTHVKSRPFEHLVWLPIKICQICDSYTVMELQYNNVAFLLFQ